MENACYAGIILLFWGQGKNIQDESERWSDSNVSGHAINKHKKCRPLLVYGLYGLYSKTNGLCRGLCLTETVTETVGFYCRDRRDRE